MKRDWINRRASCVQIQHHLEQRGVFRIVEVGGGHAGRDRVEQLTIQHQRAEQSVFRLVAVQLAIVVHARPRAESQVKPTSSALFSRRRSRARSPMYWPNPLALRLDTATVGLIRL